MEERFEIGDTVEVIIYGSGPATWQPELGRVTGFVLNAGSEYDVKIDEPERDTARDFLNDCETGLGDLVAQDFWLLRNCQPHQLELLVRPDVEELALDALGDAIDEIKSLVGDELSWKHQRLEKIYEQLIGRMYP